MIKIGCKNEYVKRVEKVDQSKCMFSE